MNAVTKTLAAATAPLFAAACALLPAAASAETHSWQVINDGSTTVDAIYTAEAGTDKPWARVRPANPLPAGYHVDIDETGGVCDWDVKIVWSDGHTETFDDIDTCANNLRVWY